MTESCVDSEYGAHVLRLQWSDGGGFSGPSRDVAYGLLDHESDPVHIFGWHDLSSLRLDLCDFYFSSK